MIDLIINEFGGVTVAHTLRSLDGYDSLDINLDDGTTVLSGPKGERRLGHLQPTMLSALKPDMCGQAVRVAGWSIAKITPLAISTHH